jgi:hypothetical protein
MNNREYSELEIDILLGLDDIAHNRLYNMDLDTGASIPVSNYGRRNRNEKCYCKLLRKLGVSRD